MRTGPWQTERPARGLFAHLPAPRSTPSQAGRPRTAPAVAAPLGGTDGHAPVDELRSVFERAPDPADTGRLLELFVGQQEATVPPVGRDAARDAWVSSRRRRTLSSRELLEQPALPHLVKSVFDFYFRDDLYGYWAGQEPIILSSGSFDETVFGLPASLKDCIRYALDRNWYGYSDSLGRASAREALAVLETVRFGGRLTVGADRIAVTLGGTAALDSIVDLLAGARPHDTRPALCAVPNYPPLMAAMARRMPVHCVETPIVYGGTDITALIERARGGARMILLQTVTNPSGLRVPEERLAELIEAAPPDCYIVLDECHDAFGPEVPLTPARMADNVISIRSVSKRWGAPGLKAGWLVASPDVIDEFYGQASTTYGGPPSLFYLLIEMLGLFEAARLGGAMDVPAVLGRLSDDYGLNTATLEAGFADYLRATEEMTERVLRCRRHAVDALDSMGVPVLVPEYSINLLARFGNEPSYRTYRRLISETGVSTYPGLLCVAGGPGLVRLSPCLPESVLDEAMARLAKWAARREEG
ncbi:pyridoxal phosphate-dependent aminotransferase [Streptomyces sp. NPDC050617]|uniref:pyridoxal phosphate-dependent aminotransferase n=1 Tax=Streptomyces sp. NPDC050617 TaxID=3154628 RepID=UPI0034221C9B